MKKISETAFAVWIAVLFAIVLFVLTSKFIDWPGWKDSFWSGWAQTIGATVAVVAAIRIGQNQLKADELLRQRDLEDQRRLALHLAYGSLFEASTAMTSLAEDRRIEDHALHGVRDLALGRLEEASQALKEPLRMPITIGVRGKILEAKTAVDQFVAMHRLLARPLSTADFEKLSTKARELKSLKQTLGEWMMTAETRHRPTR